MISCSMKYPRVLIVGYDVIPGTGSGITLACLFKEWPRNQIAIAASGADFGKSNYAGKYYRIGTLEDRWVWPLSLLPRENWKVSGPITPGIGSEQTKGVLLDCPVTDSELCKKAVPVNLIRRLFYTSLNIAGANDLARSLHLSNSFLSWVLAYQPDIIYSLLGSLGLVRLLSNLSDETGIPLALHFMDDWPSVAGWGGFMAPIVRRKLKRDLDSIIEKASVLMTISDAMSQEYKRRYRRDFLTFHNALDLDDWLGTTKTSWEVTPPFEVLYAGRIGIANLSSLVDVAHAVDKVAQTGLSIRFTILTRNNDHSVASRLKQLSCVDVIPALPHAEVPARLAAADLLVLPLDFGDTEQRFAKYSMPTKAVEYMASGTPTVIYAPSEHAVSRYAKSEGWAVIVGERDIDALAEVFLYLAKDTSKRKGLGQRSSTVANANHDANVVREAFREAMYIAARSVRLPHSALAVNHD